MRNEISNANHMVLLEGKMSMKSFRNALSLSRTSHIYRLFSLIFGVRFESLCMVQWCVRASVGACVCVYAGAAGRSTTPTT